MKKPSTVDNLSIVETRVDFLSANEFLPALVKTSKDNIDAGLYVKNYFLPASAKTPEGRPRVVLNLKGD